MKKKIRVETVYPHPPERVWKALTDSDAIADWLMPNDFKPELGHRFQFKTRPRPGFNGIVDCQVIEVDEPHRLWEGRSTPWSPSLCNPSRKVRGSSWSTPVLPALGD
jgi:uncharacterized protein YndB with AHSA1/START domain